jgi:uncharacterized protein YdhG (YjbR/CyaY superfamily)
MEKPADVDAYIKAAPAEAQPHLRELRGLILRTVPEVNEKIAYGMPTFDLRGRRFVHIAAAKNHVAIYALVHEDANVPAELAPHLDHRSTLQFDFTETLPVGALTAALTAKAQLLGRPRMTP